MALGVAKALGDSRLEYAVRLLLENAECREVRDWQALLVKDGEVETFVMSIGSICDDFHSQEEELLLSFLFPSLYLGTLLIETLLWGRNEPEFVTMVNPTTAYSSAWEYLAQ